MSSRRNIQDSHVDASNVGHTNTIPVVPNLNSFPAPSIGGLVYTKTSIVPPLPVDHGQICYSDGTAWFPVSSTPTKYASANGIFNLGDPNGIATAVANITSGKGSADVTTITVNGVSFSTLSCSFTMSCPTTDDTVMTINTASIPGIRELPTNIPTTYLPVYAGTPLTIVTTGSYSCDANGLITLGFAPDSAGQAMFQLTFSY